MNVSSTAAAVATAVLTLTATLLIWMVLLPHQGDGHARALGSRSSSGAGVQTSPRRPDRNGHHIEIAGSKRDDDALPKSSPKVRGMDAGARPLSDPVGNVKRWLHENGGARLTRQWGLPVHESRPGDLPLPTAGIPKACRLCVVLGDDGLEPNGSRFTQPSHGRINKVTGKTPAAVLGGDNEAIDRSSPAVPAGNDGSDEVTAGLGHQEAPRIEGDQPVEAVQIIGVSGLSLRHPPKRQHTIEIGRDCGSYVYFHSKW